MPQWELVLSFSGQLILWKMPTTQQRRAANSWWYMWSPYRGVNPAGMGESAPVVVPIHFWQSRQTGDAIHRPFPIYSQGCWVIISHHMTG